MQLGNPDPLSGGPRPVRTAKAGNRAAPRPPILLVNPWIHDFTAFDLWMKPLGLLYVAAVLEQSGYSVSFIDCVDPEAGPVLKGHGRYNCHRLRSEEIAKPGVFADVPRRYKRYGMPSDQFRRRLDAVPVPQLIGVSSIMTYWYPGVVETIAVLKERFPRVPVVLGGIYATLCADHARRTAGADTVLPGRGELAFLRLADDLLGVKADRSGLSDALDDLPAPAYHHYGRPSSVAMLTSLGCPFRCTYCASRALFPEFVLRDPGRVVQEIDTYTNVLGVGDIAFYDDALLANPKHIEDILDTLMERGTRARFHTPNGLHAERISPDLAGKLREAGFVTIRLGFETSNLGRQKDSDDKISNVGLRRSIQNLYGAGFGPADLMVYVLIGLPDQAAGEVLESVRFVQECGARVSLSQFSPVPGTVDFQRVVQKGFPADEPLLANKTVYPMRAMGLSYEDYERIRRVAKEGNDRILAGM